MNTMSARYIPADDVRVGDVLVTYSADRNPVESIRETPKRRFITVDGREHPVHLDRRQNALVERDIWTV